MSILPRAHDFVIAGGEFINQTNVNISSGRSGIHILLDASTPEAAVDAGERDYAPSCYPDTRVQYIEDITNWATASNGDHLPIYWMRGPAGVGKSAIAQTCAQKVKDAGQLGAAFFFSINGRRRDHTRFIPTLAYQLSTALPDYRENVNRRVVDDKTIVSKTMKAQFEALIIEPLRELKEQGKEVRMRSIFIDGLDECESQDAQVEIIKIIASSVHAESTPFRWAIFSRAEPYIVSTFALCHISPHCHIVYLPISRNSDMEIEIYLRGGFENILRRRNMVMSSWPADEDIRKLVDAAAGLFAYCTTILRFIDTHSFSGFKRTLQVVLEVIAQPCAHPISLFAELDRVYILILQRVPEDTLPSMLLFLCWITGSGFVSLIRNTAVHCNSLSISETVFKSICYHLQAVMTYHEPVEPFQVLDPCVDFTRPYWDQNSPLSSSLANQMNTVYGTVSLLHKSFYDFLVDPDRSSTFCVSTIAMQGKIFDHLIHQHLHIASSYIIQGSKLVLAPDVTSSSTSLSWPQGTEFVDSFLKNCILCVTSLYTFDVFTNALYAEHLAPCAVQRLAELDHRKSCVADRMLSGFDLESNVTVLGCLGHIRRTGDTTFRCIQSEGYDKFPTTKFLTSVKTLERPGIIKAFRSRIPFALALVQSPYHSRTKPGKQYGLYRVGCGERSVMWYWEFDANERYYHEFHTTNYTVAMKIYKTEKFRMWEEWWVPPSWA